MNVHEVAGLMTYFGSAWPRMEIPDDTAQVWAREMADVNIEVGREAAQNLVRSLTFFPSIAEFLAECQRITQQRRIQPVTALALSAGEKEPPPLEGFAELRQQLKDWSAKGHNHKGPEPCEVCGGRPA